jgi:xylulokinase
VSLLGLDIGTSGCKATVFSADFNAAGAVLAQAQAEYPLRTSAAGHIELDPEAVWAAAAGCIRRANDRVAADPVQALAVSVLGEAVIPVGADGAALAASPVSFDGRARRQADSFRKAFGEQRAYALTGQPVHPMFSVHKIAWWRDEQPALFARAWKFLCYGDFVLLKLGVEPAIDYSMAARTQAFDVTANQWADEVLAWAGLTPERLAQPVPAGTVVGVVPAHIAADLGFRAAVTVVAGGHDQPCGALGSGALASGEAMYALGTTAVLAPTLPGCAAGLAADGFPCYTHVVPGRRITLAGTPSGGSLLRWFRDEFGEAERRQAQETGRDFYALLTEQVSDEPGRLLLLPHFAGTEAPYHDPDAKGVLFGLTMNSRRADVVQAILEGVAFEIGYYAGRLRAAGVEVALLRAVGGGARSARWMQINADILNRPIAVPRVTEATCLGAALLAGWGAGCYDSLEAAARSLIAVERTFTPRPSRVEQYARRMDVYRRLYPAVRELNPLFQE